VCEGKDGTKKIQHTRFFVFFTGGAINEVSLVIFSFCLHSFVITASRFRDHLYEYAIDGNIDCVLAVSGSIGTVGVVCCMSNPWSNEEISICLWILSSLHVNSCLVFSVF
jgi:hypothetical protein